jgi:acyl-CoA thioesterase
VHKCKAIDTLRITNCADRVACVTVVIWFHEPCPSNGSVIYKVSSKNSENLNSAPEPVVVCPSAARCG